MRLNVHTSAPVRAFHARITGVGRRRDQQILVDRGRRRICAPMSTKPPWPNSGTSLPVFASSAISRVPDDTTIRGAVVRIARPVGERRAASSPFASNFQICVPVYGIEREDAVLRRQVHHAVDDERRALEEAALVAGVNVHARCSVVHVRRVDLIERRVLRVRPVLSRRAPSCSGPGRARSHVASRATRDAFHRLEVSAIAV